MNFIVILITKIISRITGLLGGGTSLPGEIALKLSPGILKTLSSGYRVVLVTGTNGKTTTCAMLTGILRQSGATVAANSSGANMTAGIVSCLASHHRFFKKMENPYAVLEVDEAYARHITAQISPEIICVTNIFRDQLDRYGEVETTLDFIKKACENAPSATLVLNADESMLADLCPQNKRVFYGFTAPLTGGGEVNAEGKFCKNCGVPYSYEFVTFNHLGNYKCPSCGHARPEIDIGIDKIFEISAQLSRVSINGREITIMQPGAYNIYNALCAAAAAKTLGVSSENISEGIRGQKSKFGRQETVMIGDTELRIILVKNPAGCNEAINSILPDEGDITLGVLLSDSFADGTDVSWIYDVHFEQLIQQNIKKVLVGGSRCYDMAIRLKVSGLPLPFVYEDYDGFLNEIKTASGRVYLLATYTEMVSFRRYLHKKKYIRELWG